MKKLIKVYPVLTQQFKLSILIAKELKAKMSKCKANLLRTYSDLPWITKITSHPKRKQLYDDSIPFTALQSQRGSTTGLANNKSHVYDFTLQHADSEGALLGERCSLQPATSVSTLAPSLGEPQAESPCVEDLIPRRDSLEQLSPTDSDPKLGSSPGEGGQELEEAKEEEGESYKEDLLMGDDQVADFASSVLAAISCWHYRARALLSTHFTTVRVSATYGFPISCSIPLAYQYSATLSPTLGLVPPSFFPS